ncbi:DUF974 domain-containing protein [Phlyctema vagabunda]|uniref:DUF974 domain-containing protein n=1 Tax=Phlyctema vagabunda TaxID=108571 RepID=A0ABR4P391_9HELO
MSIRVGSSQLSRQLSRLRLGEIPEFLCPILRSTVAQPVCKHSRHYFVLNSSSVQKRFSHASVQITDDQETSTSSSASPPQLQRELPPQCVGCGAFSQTYAQDEPGYYTTTRRAVSNYINGRDPQGKQKDEDDLIDAALKNVDSELVKNLGLDTIKSREVKPQESPVCDRCHKLKHHEAGVSIQHPSIQSIQDTIFESPHKYNHIYHVIDAADFPMSLVSNLYRLLKLTPQRALNRRSKSGKFYHGRKTEISFIITRADLLAPLKTQVDSLMPYLTSVLRDALGKAGQDVRLGNVRCVSAVRGWWTKELKEDIWSRGGGGWMVGKVNVGKSQLFSVVFPKGRRSTAAIGRPTQPAGDGANVPNQIEAQHAEATEVESTMSREKFTDPSALLPPVQAETDFPTMPLVSALPGTTASPIRVPFGNGKGELIDLPGLSRRDLEHYVKEKFRPKLLMRSRIRPEQQTVKPGQSLLLGGFIRITPTSPETIILAYAFTPILAHLTSTEKAIGVQTQSIASGVSNITLPGVGENIAKAGTFHLKWDVTKQRTGPVTARDGAAIKPEKLPYKVLATDILIEGCGWVELVAQVRKGPGEMTNGKTTDQGDEVPEPAEEEVDPSWPVVEVFSPEGRCIASRKPMNAWSFLAQKPVSSKGRPRQSMRGAKKAYKSSEKK